MKLNLGCGSDLLPDYLNVDIQRPKRSKTGENVDQYEFKQSSAQELSWLKDNSVSEIRAKDIIDHIHWQDLETTFREWKRVLEIGGKLILRDIPDFEKSFNQYFQSNRTKQDWKAIQHWVEMLSWSEERFRSKNLLDAIYLEKLLESCSFKIEKSWYEDDLNLDCIKINELEK